MSKGENVPSSVGYFGHTDSTRDKGKNHPDVGRGPNMVETYNSTKPTVAPASKAGGTHQPAGVKRGDGTETRRGITVKSIRVTPKGPSTKGNDSALPGGVRKLSGLSAPGKVK